MGKALYREYRPKRLEDVVGQDHITTTLKNAIKKGAISHAYLFTGPRGVGKTSVARIMAHEINELSYTDESMHLDIIEIDAASNRRIDEIRDLRDKVHIAPTSAKYKVYIIDEVHMLTREAFNALLKTLEEPPEHVIFILATTESHKVPDTIVSRTQKFTFKPISTQETVKHLSEIAKKEKIVIDNNALELIATHGNGSFRDSISMLDQLAGLPGSKVGLEEVQMLLGIPKQEIIKKVISAVETSNILDIFSAVSEFRESGIDSGRAALAISETFREQLMNDSLQISQSTAVKLLKELLQLTTSSHDFIGLELALIDALVLAEKPSKTLVTSLMPTTEAKPESTSVDKISGLAETTTPDSKNDSEVIDKEDKQIKPPKLSSSSKETWNELLNDLKGKHNTLYGLLRMAEISENNGKLELKFRFGFHKKQIDSAQNTTTLSDYMKTYFGTKGFATVHDKSTEISNKSTGIPREQHNPDMIKNVSNIFSGAELLE